VLHVLFHLRLGPDSVTARVFASAVMAALAGPTAEPLAECRKPEDCST
jgi:hypothetical protein